MKLSDREWKEFFLEDLFIVKAGKRLTNADKVDGVRPFIGATDNTNGVTGFVDNVNSSLDKNVLGVNYNGAPCIGFYHPYECIFTDDVKRLHLKNYEDNAYVLLFMKAVIMQQRSKYSYGYKFNERRMLRQLLSVPVTETGDPDYEFMEDYVRELMLEKRKQYRDFVEKRLAELGVDVKFIGGGYKESLASREWKDFAIPYVFQNIQRGKRLKNAEHVPGIMPYVSSTANNNGVDDYIEATKGTRVFENCISLANSGSVGTAFYEPFAFVASDHVTSLKCDCANEYIYLFLTAVLEQQSSNFNFNREINDLRIKKMRIMLPISDKDKPDYEFMEGFMRGVMLNKYLQYLSFCDNQIHKYENINRKSL